MLYVELKENLRIPDDIENRRNTEDNDEDDFFRDLEGDYMQTNTEE